MSGPKRREFLKSAVLAGAGVGLSPFVPGLPPAEGALPATRDVPSAPSWIARPMRWAQLTLVEDDPVKFDARLLARLLRAHAFRRRLPERRRVRRLLPDHGALPPPQRLARRARRPRRADRRLPEAGHGGGRAHRPARDVRRRAGRASRLDRGGRRRKAPTALGLARDVGHLRARPLQLRVHDRGEAGDRVPLPGRRHLRQPLDGLRHVLLPALPDDLPRRHRHGAAAARPIPEDPAAPAPHLLWRQQRLFELWRLWDAEVRKINPDACVIPNTGGGATSRLDMKRIGELAPMMAADRQARSGLMAPWAIGMNAKEYRATLGRKPVAGLFSVGVEEPYRWKDSVQSADEIRLWVADLVANGMRPWFSKFAGALHDPALAEAGRGDLRLVPRRRALPAQRAAARARRPRLLAADAPGSTAATRFASGSRIPPSAGTRRSSRRACPSRWSTTACSTPSIWRPSAP